MESIGYILEIFDRFVKHPKSEQFASIECLVFSDTAKRQDRKNLYQTPDTKHQTYGQFGFLRIHHMCIPYTSIPGLRQRIGIGKMINHSGIELIKGVIIRR